MKYGIIALAILAALCVSLALADDFKTVNGKEYKNATVSRVEPDGIVLRTKSGILKLYFTELPKEVQQRFNYDPEKAAEYSAAQNAATQKKEERSPKEQASAGDPFTEGWKFGYDQGYLAAQERIFAHHFDSSVDPSVVPITGEELNRKAWEAAATKWNGETDQREHYAVGYRQGFEQGFKDKARPAF